VTSRLFGVSSTGICDSLWCNTSAAFLPPVREIKLEPKLERWKHGAHVSSQKDKEHNGHDDIGTPGLCCTNSGSHGGVTRATVDVSRGTPCSLPEGYRLLEGHTASIFRVEIRHRKWRERVFPKRLYLMKAYVISESGKHYLRMAQQSPRRPGLPHFRGFTIPLRHTKIDRTALDSDQPDAETST
jgi:hypothetical protein